MVKVTKKILALMIACGLLGTSVFGTVKGSQVYAAPKAKTNTSAEVKAPSAAGAKDKDQSGTGFIEGKVLGAYDFDGLRVTFNGKETYTIKKGDQPVTLSITVLDEQRAKVGIEKLILVFGRSNIVNKKGATTVRAFTLAAKKPEQKTPEKVQTTSQPSQESGSTDEAASSSEPVEEPGNDLLSAYRTVIMYLIGADIESDGGNMSKQLLDMLESDIPKSTRFILVTGGSEAWHMNDYECYKQYAAQSLFPNRTSYDVCTDEEKARIDGAAEKLLKKYGTDISGIQIWEIESSYGVNSLKLLRTVDNEFMINPAFLTESINFATNHAPAQHYDLILSGHGSGLDGFGYDDLYDAWKTDIPEEEWPYSSPMRSNPIAEAFAASELVKNGGKFELLGFDSCIMGSYEVASLFSKYADYYVASEENELDSGWKYSDIINATRNNPYITGEGLAKAVTDGYAAQHTGEDLTMSGVDIKQMDRLDEALTEFSSCLYSEPYENYYHIMRDLGGDSHFDIRYGFYASNIYDLRRIAVSFSEDERLSEELRSASRTLVGVLSDTVIANFSGKEENGGLSIYFPRHSMNLDYGYFTVNSKYSLSLYEECGINESYTEAVKKLAFRDMIGIILGNVFYGKENDISIDDVLRIISKNEELQYLVDTVGLDRNNPEDPYIGIIQRMIDERIHTGKITAATPEKIYDDEEHWHYAEAADVIVSGTDSESVDDRILVEVTLGDTGASLGTTIAYSDEMKNAAEEDGKELFALPVSAFDQKWYTLNGQITGMYITNIKEDGSGFFGYIPLLRWESAESAAGTEDENQDRNQYILDAALEGLNKMIRLNVECNVSTDDGGNVRQNLTPVNVENVDYYTIDDDRYLDMEEFVSRYYELYSGDSATIPLDEAPDFSSLGTIYIDDKGTVDIASTYVENLSPTYFFTDVYGNDYEVTEAFLGEDEDGNSKGLDDFYQPIPADVPEEDIVTWEESQALAEQVREQAAQEAKAAEDAKASEASPEVPEPQEPLEILDPPEAPAPPIAQESPVVEEPLIVEKPQEAPTVQVVEETQDTPDVLVFEEAQTADTEDQAENTDEEMLKAVNF